MKVMQQTNHRRIDRGTAEFLNKVVNLNLVYDEPEEEGAVDKCKAMEDYTKKTEIIGVIKGLKLSGQTVEQIIKLVSGNYHVSKEYVENLMNLIPA